jgi:enoyl-CoA hydratase/carnithine racemase
MDDFLLYERDGGIVTLTMNSPATRNALAGERETRCFEQMCDRINADRDVRCVILTGAGDAFCSGGNVKDMLAKRGLTEGTPLEIMERYRSSIQRIPLSLYRLEVPLIAAVNGPAYGAGCDIACMCDIRIASTTARFAESFTKLGIVAGDGGSWFLPRAVGFSRAAEMSFTGDPVDAQTALAWGLVSRVVSPDALAGEARALAERIAANPGPSLRLAKRLLREGQRCGLESLLEMTAGFQAIAHHTEEHMRAMQKLFKEHGT